MMIHTYHGHCECVTELVLVAQKALDHMSCDKFDAPVTSETALSECGQCSSCCAAKALSSVLIQVLLKAELR